MLIMLIKGKAMDGYEVRGNPQALRSVRLLTSKQKPETKGGTIKHD